MKLTVESNTVLIRELSQNPSVARTADVADQYRPLGPVFERSIGSGRKGFRGAAPHKLVWSRKLPGSFHRAAPVMDGAGRIYVASSDDLRGGGATVACLNRDTGRILWSRGQVEAIKNSVAPHGNHLLATSGPIAGSTRRRSQPEIS
jgi:hypothetical protein